jgi:UDP-glucose 4-epimerase
MRVFVTGGAGYIGSVVVSELLDDGHDVVAFDNLSKGHRGAVDERASFVHGDLADQGLVEASLREHAIDAVVHMAAASLVGESVTDPGKYYRSNVVYGLNLLDAMRVSGVARLVFSSTAAVYGEPEKQPIEETDSTRPTNTYGETKLAFERALSWYDSAYAIRFASLRYFNACGATARCGEVHEPETHLIPLVLQVAAGRRESIAVFGDDYPTRDGTCVRDYVHVVDLARAHILALEALDTGSRTYNLGCGGGFTVKEVIDVAREVTGHPIPTTVAPRRPGDPAVLVASSERIRSDLGWSPRFESLSEIVGSAWRWMREHPDGYVR